MSPKKKYQEAASHALAGFQLIEAGLKDYIGIYYESVKILLNGKLIFKFSKDDVNEFPLERLLTTFSKISRNEELIKKLRKLVKDRNELAHKALVYLYSDSMTDMEFEDASSKLVRAAEELGLVMKDIHKECVEIENVLREQNA